MAPEGEQKDHSPLVGNQLPSRGKINNLSENYTDDNTFMDYTNYGYLLPI